VRERERVSEREGRSTGRCRGLGELPLAEEYLRERKRERERESESERGVGGTSSVNRSIQRARSAPIG
jgi:hypothetical protein